MVTHLMIDGLCYSIAGLVAGFLSGLMGMGGGIIVVPALLMTFSHDSAVLPSLAMPIAVGTSLTVMIVTSFFSLRTHYQMGNLRWSLYQRMALGVIIGTCLGGLLADSVPSNWLKGAFSIFLIAVALKMLFYRNTLGVERYPAVWLNALVSVSIGLISGLLGLGGGIMMVPWLTWCGIEMKKISAVSSLCTMTVALVGTLTYIITGLNETNLPLYSTGYVYWLAVVCVAIPGMLTAPLGAKLANTLPASRLNYLFVGILLTTAIVMCC